MYVMHAVLWQYETPVTLSDSYVLNFSELRRVYVKDDTTLSLTRSIGAADVVVFVVVDAVDGHYLNLRNVQFTCEPVWPSGKALGW